MRNRVALSVAVFVGFGVFSLVGNAAESQKPGSEKLDVGTKNLDAKQQCEVWYRDYKDLGCPKTPGSNDCVIIRDAYYRKDEKTKKDCKDLIGKSLPKNAR